MMGTKKVGASAGPLTKAELIVSHGAGIQKEILAARLAQAPCFAGGVAVESGKRRGGGDVWEMAWYTLV